MPTKTTPAKSAQEETHTTVSEKLHDALSGFNHMIHEIHFKEMVSNAAHYITSILHKKEPETTVKAKKIAKKPVKKAAKKTAVKKVTVKKTAKKTAGKK